jgi:hypothetical protein
MLPAEGISGWFIHFMMNDCTNKMQKGKKKLLDCRKILSPFPFLFFLNLILVVIFFYLSDSDVQIDYYEY